MRRPGLSFEIAPPPAADPLRTDIVFFAGLAARRARVHAAGALLPLPPVLLAWLGAQPLAVPGLPDQLRGAAVQLDDPAAFATSVVAALPLAARAGVTAWFATFDPPRREALAELLAACRDLSPLPAPLIDELRARHLTPQRIGDAAELEGWLRVQRLFNLPLRVDGFGTVEALFETRRAVLVGEPAEGAAEVFTPLASALRAFFGEGGQLAFVLRCGDPLPLLSRADEHLQAAFPGTPNPDRCAIVPGTAGAAGTAAVALSSADWQGLEQIYALPEASFAVLPDLAELASVPPADIAPPEGVVIPERFADCAEEGGVTPPAAGRRVPAPRLDAAGLQRWRSWLVTALTLLDNGGRAFHRRDVQLLASLPLVHAGADAPGPDGWLDWMARRGSWLDEGGAEPLLDERLQLAWPWLVTRESGECPGGVEAPEGSLAGALARSALERGSFRSAARQPLRRLVDTEPRPAWSRALEAEVTTPLGPLTLAQRLCLLGPAPGGARLLSDVSCSDDPRTRQASVRRLVNVVIQAARRLGEQHAFESNGEALWARLRSQVGDLLQRLLVAGALSPDGGGSSVRCGRETMTQADLDAGRLIVEIGLQPAQPVQRIVVVLNLREASGALPALSLAA